jgi:RNA polymerase sigma-B factor
MTGADHLSIAHGPATLAAMSTMTQSTPRRRSHTEEDLRLLRRYHEDGDQRAREELAERLLPFVRSVARRYAQRGEPFEDLVQVGCIGLLKAIDRFDPERGARLMPFAEANVSGEIKRHFRDRTWAVHVPRDVQELSLKVGRAVEAMTAETGRSPSPRELAERLNVETEDVVEALIANQNYRTASIDHVAGAEDDDARPQIGMHDERFERADRLDALRSSTERLSPREREIVYLRFYEGLLQREIAERVGISQMHVSRLLRRSLEVMREDLAGTPGLAQLEAAEAV